MVGKIDQLKDGKQVFDLELARRAVIKCCDTVIQMIELSEKQLIEL